MALPPDEERVYRALFLTAEDVTGLEAREAVHRQEPEAGDDAWEACHGMKAGFQVWQRLRDTELTRLVDARWLFPTEVDARRYHEARLAANAEGLRPVPGFLFPSGDVAAFSSELPFGLGARMEVYLFVLGRVCAKVFATGLGEDASLAVLKHAAGRIGNALRPDG